MLIILSDSCEEAKAYLDRKGLDSGDARICTTAEGARAVEFTGRGTVVQVGSVDNLLYELMVK